MFTLPALLTSLSVFAASIPQPAVPAALAHWVDADGSLETQHEGSLQAEWFWNENPAPRRKGLFDDPDPKLSFGGPALRVYLHTRHIPKDWVYQNAVSDTAAVVTIEKTKDGDPRLRRLVIDAHAALATLLLNFKSASKQEHVTLALTVPGGPPTAILHRTCGDFRLSPLKGANAGPGRHIFLGLACAEDEGQFFFHVIRSNDSRWAYRDEEDTKPELLFTIDKSADRLVNGDALFKIRTRDLEGRLSEHAITCAAGAKSCKKTTLWREPE